MSDDVYCIDQANQLTVAMIEAAYRHVREVMRKHGTVFFAAHSAQAKLYGLPWPPPPPVYNIETPFEVSQRYLFGNTYEFDIERKPNEPK